MYIYAWWGLPVQSKQRIVVLPARLINQHAEYQQKITCSNVSCFSEHNHAFTKAPNNGLRICDCRFTGQGVWHISNCSLAHPQYWLIHSCQGDGRYRQLYHRLSTTDVAMCSTNHNKAAAAFACCPVGLSKIAGSQRNPLELTNR